jgi:protoporphyrinogen/coproporphyrinogen III oxidase
VIAVVGGGITGLAVGWELRRHGADYVVLESAAEPGGVIRSHEVEGRVLDAGPQRTRLTASMRALVEELGLSAELLTAPADLDLFVYARGRLRRVPFSVGGMLASDVIGLGAKLRAALEPLTRAADPGERVDAFFRRKFGDELYEVVIGPLYGGLYASDPADMEVGRSLVHVLRELDVGRSLLLTLLRRGGRVSPPPACSFREGMQALPRALASRLGDRLRLSCPVSRLERASDGWRLETPTGTLHAQTVVFTTPADATACIVAASAPEAAERLRRLTYNPLAVVHLDAEIDARGFGFQVAFTEPGFALRGVTFNDSLFGRRNLHTAYLGGAHRPDVVGTSDEEIARVAVADFRRSTGRDARPLSVTRQRVAAWDVSWRALDGLQEPAGLRFAGSWRSRPGIAGRLAEARSLAAALTGRAAS